MKKSFLLKLTLVIAIVMGISVFQLNAQETATPFNYSAIDREFKTNYSLMVNKDRVIIDKDVDDINGFDPLDLRLNNQKGFFVTGNVYLKQNLDFLMIEDMVDNRKIEKLKIKQIEVSGDSWLAFDNNNKELETGLLFESANDLYISSNKNLNIFNNQSDSIFYIDEGILVIKDDQEQGFDIDKVSLDNDIYTGNLKVDTIKAFDPEIPIKIHNPLELPGEGIIQVLDDKVVKTIEDRNLCERVNLGRMAQEKGVKAAEDFERSITTPSATCSKNYYVWKWDGNTGADPSGTVSASSAAKLTVEKILKRMSSCLDCGEGNNKVGSQSGYASTGLYYNNPYNTPPLIFVFLFQLN